MSSIRHSKSFRNVKNQIITLTSIESHEFIYDPNDIHMMQGHLGYLAEMGGVQGFAAALRTDLKNGLYRDEVESSNFAKRESIYSKNVFPKAPLKTFLELMWEGLQDPMLIVLMIAGVISVGLGLVHSLGSGWIEGLSIIFAVVLVDLVGAFNQWNQQRQFSQMDTSKEVDMVSLIRDGQTIQVVPDDIQVGDLVLLTAGSFVPADGILVADESIKVNESRLTGESRDVTKSFYEPFLYGGTEVREGQALMLTVAVGVNSAYGRIMSALAEEDTETPLQKKLEDAAKLIGYIGVATAVLLFTVLVIRWGVDFDSSEESTSEKLNKLLTYFIISVTIIVVAVPEGLPLAVIVSLAYSMRKMLKDNLMVRKLAACETMGNCTTICSDKTGTLTQNLMTVVKVYLGGVEYETIPSKEQVSPILRQLVIESVVVNSKAWCSTEEMDPNRPPESWPWKDGNQTEISLLAWSCRYGISVPECREQYMIEKNYPFDSIKKQSSVLMQSGNSYRRYYKGAADFLLDGCDRYVDHTGNVRPIDKPAMQSLLLKMTSSGLRTIAFAYEEINALEFDEDGNVVDPAPTTSAIFIGCVGIKDPLRPESYDSVRQCQRAGIVVRMVTGDHLETAKFIARECGILTSEKHVAMVGAEFRKLVASNNTDAIDELLPRLRVLARSKPEDKETLVRLLRSKGHVVAATGDGTNDAPALKAADVGIAMFIEGTAVAKSAAEIWILDDNFLSIVMSVMWGRSVFDNIRKFVQFQLAINLVALSITFIGACAGFSNPLTAVQLLWVNLIMDTFAALALGTEMPTLELLNRRPYSLRTSLISQVMWRNLTLSAVAELIILLIILFRIDLFFDYVKEKSEEHYTIVFNCFVWLQIFNQFNARKVMGEMNVFSKIFSNMTFSIILVIIIGMQILMVEVLKPIASTVSLKWDEWLFCVGIGACMLVVGVFIRLIPVDINHGQIDIPAETFEGADLSAPIHLNTPHSLDSNYHAPDRQTKRGHHDGHHDKGHHDKGHHDKDSHIIEMNTIGAN